jgi:hypothetical protein
VTTSSKAATHKDTDKFKEAEMIGAISFWIDHPF